MRRTASEKMEIIRLVDATTTFLLSFGVPVEEATDGEALAFDPADDLLYRASGIGAPNGTEIFETIEPGTLAVVNVPLSGFDYEELTVLFELGGGFYAGDLGAALVDMPRFLRITTGGAVTYLGDMDHVTRGLVPVEPPGLPVPALSMPLCGVLVVSVMLAGRGRLGRQSP